MNIVDSCGWLEYLADGPNAGFFAPPLEDQDKLLVPTICITEAFKKILLQRGEDAALQAAALIQQGNLAHLDNFIAVEAARLGYMHNPPLADGIILATAYLHKAVVWTQDVDFRNLDNARYAEKQQAGREPFPQETLLSRFEMMLSASKDSPRRTRPSSCGEASSPRP